MQTTVDEIAPDVIYLPSLFAPGSLAVLWRRALGAIRPTVVVAPGCSSPSGATTTVGRMAPWARRHSTARLPGAKRLGR